MEHYTSIKQSVKLLGLGLDPSSSDMCWEHMENCDGNFPYYSRPECHKAEEENDIPCWSVGALMKVMPQTNKFHTKVDIEFNRVTFEPCDDDIIQDESTFHYSDGASLIESCYNMVCWLLENNYIKKD